MSLAARAVGLRERAGLSSDAIAEAQFVLAQALWDADPRANRTRAFALAETARQALGVGPAAHGTSVEVERWLARCRAAPDPRPVFADRTR